MPANLNTNEYNLQRQRERALREIAKAQDVLRDIDEELAKRAALTARLSDLKAAGKLGVERDLTPYPMPNMPEAAKKRFKYLYEERMKRKQARDRKATGG